MQTTTDELVATPSVIGLADLLGVAQPPVSLRSDWKPTLV
jgi:hypothetical protein